MILHGSLDSAQVRIDQVIFHAIDHHVPQIAFQSATVPVTAGLSKFITAHLVKAATASTAAIFEDRGTHPTCHDIDALLDNPAPDVVTISRRLAQALLAQMTSGRIKPGTLWTVVFTQTFADGNGLGQVCRCVALLKIDILSAVTFETNGDQLEDVVIHDNALPNEEIEPDKVAFIVPENSSLPQCQLRVLDRRRRDEGVARFFMRFLNCRPALDAVAQTGIFTATLKGWTRENGEALEAARVAVDDIQALRRMMLANSDQIEVRDFATAAIGERNAPLRDSLEQALAQALDGPRFDVDPKVSRQYQTQKIELSQGPHSVMLTGSRAAIEALVQKRPNVDGSFNVSIDNVQYTDKEPRSR